MARKSFGQRALEAFDADDHQIATTFSAEPNDIGGTGYQRTSYPNVGATSGGSALRRSSSGRLHGGGSFGRTHGGAGQKTPIQPTQGEMRVMKFQKKEPLPRKGPKV